MIRRILTAGALAAVLALSACTATPGPEPTETAASPSPTPSPSETPEIPPLEELVLTTAGIAPIEVSSPVPEEAGAMVARTDEGCSEPYWRTNPRYDTDDVYWGPGSAFAIGTDVNTDEVRVVEVLSPRIKTDTGVHIGMPESELYPIYPRNKVLALGAASVWVIDQVDPGSDTSAGVMLIEVGSNAARWGDDEPRVIHMRAVMRGIEPFSIAQSDGYIIGDCPA